MWIKSVLETSKGIYHFFAQHLFLPIVLSSMLALALFAGRIWRADDLAYHNLVWNLMLAWIPYLLSLTAICVYLISPRRWWLWIFPGALWLIFFPNAPYIVTDFLHLTERYGVPIWYDIIMLASFAWSGLILAAVSLRIMQRLVHTQFGWFFGWLFVGSAVLLGGLGIYLGRFSRFNSWDLFLNPGQVVSELAHRLLNPFANMRFYGFTLVYALFLLVVYLAFHSITRLQGPKLPADG